MCITLIGNEDTAVWGYRQQSNGQPFSDDAVVAYNAKNNKANIPSQVYAGKNLSLPTEGYYGATYTWKSSDTSVISDDGKIGTVAADTQVTMEATITSGDYTYTASYPVKVIASASQEDMIPIDKEAVVAEYDDMSSFNEAEPSKKISDNTGLSISFYAEGVVSDWDTIAKTTDGKYTMHLSVLSGEQCNFYEAKAVVSDYAKSQGYTSASVWQAFLSKKCYVTVSYNTDGSIAYYMNGNLMMTYEADATPSWNETGYASTPKAIASNVITAYKNGLFQFDPSFADSATQGSISISGIMVGFAADFDPDNYVEADYGQYLYYEDYDNVGSTNAWKAQNTQAGISTESDESHGKYASLKVASAASGNRYAYNKFTDISSDLSKYTVEMDVALTGGDRDDRSQSAFAILDQSSAMTGYADNYLVKMTTNKYSAATPSTRYTWYINDDTTGVEIPTGEWVHLKAYVDVSAGKVTFNITKDGTSLYSKSTAYSGTGLVGGIFAQLGRQNGATAIDNIKVYNGTEEPTATLVTKSKLSYGKTITPSVTSASNVQWYRCDTYKGTETAISGATSLSYEPVKADFGKYLIMKSSNVTLYYEEPVAEKEISLSMKAENKEYDGTNSANVSYTLDGVVSGDDLEVKAECVTFADANVGNNKTVTATGISLAGTDAKYYTLKVSTATATANITAKADNNNGANTSTTPGTTSDSTPAVGKTAVVSKATYKLTSGSEVTLVKGNTKATSVTVGTTVKIQGKKYKVTAIAANAFKKSKKLKKVTIGANIKSIGKNAFYGCKKLKTISIKTTKLSTSKVGKNAFKGIQAKVKITVPKKKFKAYKTMLKKRGVGKNAKITKK